MIRIGPAANYACTSAGKLAMRRAGFLARDCASVRHGSAASTADDAHGSSPANTTSASCTPADRDIDRKQG
jgi:hypothetical protein